MKISIVTPSFNQAAFIGKTIDSVASQGHADVEHIVIDGGSTDGTVDLLRANEKRLAYWVSEKDRGQSHAINKGMAHATGVVVGWINSDDIYLPGAFRAVAAFFEENPDAEVCCGGLVIINADGEVRDAVLPLPEPNLAYSLRIGLEIHQQALFVKRATWERLGGVDESLSFAMDYDLIIRLMLTATIGRAHGFLGAIRQHGETKTRNMAQIGQSEIAHIRERYGKRVWGSKMPSQATLRMARLYGMVKDFQWRYLLFKLLAARGVIVPDLIGVGRSNP